MKKIKMIKAKKLVLKTKPKIVEKTKQEKIKKTKAKIKLIDPKELNQTAIQAPSKAPDIKYEFNSVKKRLYDTGYSNNIVVNNDAARQDDVYNPVLNKESVDDLVRKTKMNNNYGTDNYINPFLQEKFDVWKSFHRIDIQIKYAIDSYSAPKGL